MKFGGGIVSMITGGIAAEATGGDFSEGALTAMVVFLYNDIGDYRLRQGLGRRDIPKDMHLRAVQRAGSHKEIVKARKKIAALFSNGAEVVMMVGGVGDVFYITKGVFDGGRSFYSFNKKAATGGSKQWIHIGKSYSKATGLRTMAIRWGTNNHFGKRIGSQNLRVLNSHLRNMRLPVNSSWGALDPEHFHLWVLKEQY